jgi:hypothetical protein
MALGDVALIFFPLMLAATVYAHHYTPATALHLAANSTTCPSTYNP